MDQYINNYPDNMNFQPISVAFTLDQEAIQTQRSVYTIADAMAQTGGFLGIIQIVFALLVSRIQENLYFQAIIKEIFTTERGSKEQKNKIDKVKVKESSIVDFEPTTTKQETDSKQRQTKFEQLLQDIQSRKPFIYTLKEYVMGACFCKKTHHQMQRKLQYEKGVEKLQKSFEITTLIKELRRTKLMTHIFFAKYQRALIPYFKQYLLRDQKLSLDLKKQPKEDPPKSRTL